MQRAAAEEAALAAALSRLGVAVAAAEARPQLQALELLQRLDLTEQHDELQEELLADLENALERADGEAGDSIKYKYAAAQMERRWQLYLALYGH